MNIQDKIIQTFGVKGDKQIRDIISKNTTHEHDGFERGMMYKYLAKKALKSGKVIDWIN